MVHTLAITADIVVQAADGDLLAFIEVKNRADLSPDDAVWIRRNLLEISGLNRRSRYFMVVSEDVGYVWEQRPGQDDDGSRQPDLTFPMAAVVSHYLPSFAGGERVSESALELAVSQWLWDLSNGVEDRPRAPESSLAKTAFLRLIRRGRIGTEVDL